MRRRTPPRGDDLLRLLAPRRGHFEFESRKHGDVWLDLDALFLRPELLTPFASELGDRLAVHGIDAICGPETGGALLGQMVAAHLDLAFFVAERRVFNSSVEYRIPAPLRASLQGRSVALVDDAINAASAIRATYAELKDCHAEVIVVGCLCALGNRPSEFAALHHLAFEALALLPTTLWGPEACPLCAAQVPVDQGRGSSERCQ